MIQIEDNGSGVPEHLKEHLFDPFVTTKPYGTGLGLALVAKIINDHGGIIECDSEPKRTVFRVLLPMQDRPSAAELPLEPEVIYGPWHHPHRRRRHRDPHRAQSGAGPCRLRAARHRQRRHAVALGEPGRGRRRHHRRRDAGRERLRPHPAHQEDPARSADHRHERAEHADDGADRGREGRLRVPAQAVRSQRDGRRRRPRADAAGPPPAAADAGDRERGAAADRPLAGDAGDLPRPRPPDADRPHGDDQRRERHRQGAGRARAARLRPPPPGAVRRRSTWRPSRAS